MGTGSKARSCMSLAVIMLALMFGAVYHYGQNNLTGRRMGTKLLLLTFDGVRHDFVDRAPNLPAFKYLIKNGVRAKYVKGSFPSQSSPSHFTIATGLYTESHGVVSNCVFNVSEHKHYKQCSSFDGMAANEWWDNGAEPIWITAVKQGLKSGAYLYPGSGLSMGGINPTLGVLKVKPETEESESYRHVDKIIKWFTDEDLDMIALTFGDPDSHVHKYGPDSKKIKDEVLPMISRIMMYLFEKVEEAGLTDDLNIIITSDHGHYNLDLSLPDEEQISLQNYVDFDIHVDTSLSYATLGLIQPKPGHDDYVYKTFKNANSNMKVYLKEELPERWHYKNNPRLPSVIILANPGYRVYDTYEEGCSHRAEHGYDPEIPEMWSFYFSIGPSFKKNYEIEGFETIHIYPLMCHILGLTPAPNNGSLDVLIDTVA